MKELEFMAFYAADFLDPEKVAGKISRLINEAEHEEIGDQYARVMLLTQALVNDKMKPEVQAGKPGQPSGLRKLIEDGKINQYAKKQKIMLEKLCYQGDFTNLACLTPFSFAMNFQFTLRKPYLSRDDAELYVIDNPIKKEWVFKVPYISPGQWKGCLHAAMVRLLAGWRKNLAGRERAELKSEFVARRLSLVRLFGNEQSVDVNDDSGEEYLDRMAPDLAGEYRERLKEMAPEGRRRGRLMFYPTFFDRFGLEVINPHDRIAGAGKFPIYFETVPEKTDGRFALLYVPFDRVGKDEGETGRQAAEDLCRVAEGIACLFSEFGFGAKTSSGFGLAGGEVKEGTLQIKFPAGWPGAGEEPLKFRSFAELEREAQKLARVLQSGQAVVSNGD